MVGVVGQLLVLPCKSPFSTPTDRRRRQPRPPRILFVLQTRPTTTDDDDDVEEKVLNLKTSVYSDNWFDRIAINHLSHCLQSTTGLKNNKSGYEGLVEASTMAWRNYDPIQQREVALKTIVEAFPTPVVALINTLLPNSKIAREFFAFFTTVYVKWLVGTSEVRESEFNGRRERNVTHIKKCRFLEESNCVGMCINLCKMPTQTFMKDHLGMPVNMVPNYDDMSCEMIYGQDPPPATEDPAFKQPCYKLCKEKQNHSTSCSS